MAYQQPTQPQYNPPQQQPMYPQQQQQTVIIQNQPQSQKGQPQNIRDWNSGICGCCEDVGVCCYSYWCYPCAVCSLAQDMNEYCCGPQCCCWTVGSLSGLFGIYAPPCTPNLFLVAMRAKMRAQHGIKGSIVSDICCMWCCEFCIVNQMKRELKNIQNNP